MVSKMSFNTNEKEYSTQEMLLVILELPQHLLVQFVSDLGSSLLTTVRQ